MSLWLRKTNELEAHAFKWAVGGSLFVYVFLVLGLFLCFKPQRKTVSLVVPRSHKAAVVSFYSGKKGNGGSGGNRGGRSGRSSLQGRAAALARLRGKKGYSKEIVAPAVSKITEKKRAAERREQERIKKVREQKELAQKQRREKERAAEEAKRLKAAKIRAEKKQQPVKSSVVDSKKSEPLSKKVEPVVPIVKFTPVAQKNLVPKVVEKPQPQVVPSIEPEKELVTEEKMEVEKEVEEVEKNTDLVEEFGIMEGMEGMGDEDGDGNGEDGYSREGAALVRSISRAWRPPRGLSPALSARLIVWLRSDGHIEKIVVDKKSGVLAFDMAAKASLWRTDFPQAFWGKNIAVFFGRMDE